MKFFIRDFLVLKYRIYEGLEAIGICFSMRYLKLFPLIVTRHFLEPWLAIFNYNLSKTVSNGFAVKEFLSSTSRLVFIFAASHKVNNSFFFENSFARIFSALRPFIILIFSSNFRNRCEKRNNILLFQFPTGLNLKDGLPLLNS